MKMPTMDEGKATQNAMDANLTPMAKQKMKTTLAQNQDMFPGGGMTSLMDIMGDKDKLQLLMWLLKQKGAPSGPSTSFTAGPRLGK